MAEVYFRSQSDPLSWCRFLNRRVVENDSEFVDYVRSIFVFDSESGVMSYRIRRASFAAGTRAGSNNPNGYRFVKVGGVSYLEHRLAWLYVFGRWPVFELDHIDGNPLNNKLANLRECSHHQNSFNLKPCKRSKSGIRGIRKSGTKWVASIKKVGESWSKSYETIDQAKSEYGKKAKELYGDFYRGR